MSDILDNEFVPQDKVAEHGGVIISVPQIFVNVSERGRDERTPNLRLIDYAQLTELMNISIQISSSTHEQLIGIWETLVGIIMRTNTQSDNQEEILTFLSFASTLGKDLDVNDEYVDSTTNCISFDVIREYKNDPSTTLLVSAEPRPWINGARLYSQLTTEQQNEARIAMNDVDMNRYHYCLQCYERTLCFEPGYVYNKTVKLANLAMFYMCLISASRPIQYHSSNDLKSNMLGYIIDVVIRSRVVQAWHNESSSKILLSDLSNNYDEKQLMVAICKLPTAKERAKFILSQFATVRNLSEIVKCLSYEAYEELLEKTKREIEGQWYYVFDNKFLTSAAALQGFAALKSLYTDAPQDDKSSLVYRIMNQE